jgi:hypothetical protein
LKQTVAGKRQFLQQPSSEMKNMETEIMNYHHVCRVMFGSWLNRRPNLFCIIAMIGCAMLCPPLVRESAGQGRGQPRTRQKEQKPQVQMEQRTDLPKIMSVTGEGGKPLSLHAQAKRVTAPPPLSEEVKTSIIKSAGVTEPKQHDSFKLTPAKPYQSQGSLSFEEIQFLFPEQNQLTIGNQDSFFNPSYPNKAVYLSMNTSAGKKYLIDFTVTGDQFFVSTDPGNTKETFSGTHHVLIVYKATSSLGVDFLLTGKGGNGYWSLHSCEVTTLN